MTSTLLRPFRQPFSFLPLGKSFIFQQPIKHYHTKNIYEEIEAKRGQLPKIVVVGGGAGGLELVTSLGKNLGRKKLAEVSLADGKPTHIWKPLLHEVATGALNVGEDEVNYFVHASQSNYNFEFGWMNGLDRQRKVIKIDTIHDLERKVVSGPREIPYDILILCVGGQTNDFGIPGVREHCFRLDSPREADKLRRRFLGEHLRWEYKKMPKVTIGIVGAGPTGVELAAGIHRTMCTLHTYGASLRHEDIELSIIEAGPTLLPGSPPYMTEFAERELKRQGINLRLKCNIKSVDEEGFHLDDGKVIKKGIKVWTAGVKAPNWLQELDLKVDNNNRIIVNKYLQSEDPCIYALGDCSRCTDIKDPTKTCPATAQCAHQQSSWLFKKLANDMCGKPTPPFTFVSQGMLVSLGHTTAVGKVSGLTNYTDYHVSGRSAKFLYSTLYRLHQAAIYGNLNALGILLGDQLRGATLPQIKLH